MGLFEGLMGPRYRWGLLSGFGTSLGNQLGEWFGTRMSSEEERTPYEDLRLPDVSTGEARPRPPAQNIDEAGGYEGLRPPDAVERDRYTPEGEEVSIPRLPKTRAMQPLGVLDEFDEKNPAAVSGRLFRQLLRGLMR